MSLISGIYNKIINLIVKVSLGLANSIIKLILKCTAAVIGFLGGTVLMWVIWFCRNKNIVAFLLNHGTNVNRVTSDGYSPLMMATLSGKYKVVEFLLKHGADALYTNETGMSAALVAKAAEHKDIEKLLEKYMLRQQNQSEIKSKDEPKYPGRRIEL